MKIIESNQYHYPEYSIFHVKIEPPLPNNLYDHVRFGVDPGTTKLGLAYLYKDTAHIYEIKITRDDDPVARILLHQRIMSQCFFMFDADPVMVIEGTIYGRHREAELSEIRASSVLWAIDHQVEPMIVHPLTIRKAVFGNAKLKAEIEWEMKEFPDAASALACAYASSLIE